jgi:hypothetical protein
MNPTWNSSSNQKTVTCHGASLRWEPPLARDAGVMFAELRMLVHPFQSQSDGGSMKPPSIGYIAIEIQNVEEIIRNELVCELDWKYITKTYALALRSSWKTDWEKVDAMIEKKLGAKKLAKIKQQAWEGKCFNSRLPPSPTVEAEVASGFSQGDNYDRRVS